MPEPLLKVADLEAGYGDLMIVRKVDLTVTAGERVLVFGPNGSGKSTLLKALAGLVPPAGGSVRLEGQEVARLPAHKIVRRGLSYVPQTENVFPDLSIAENLEIGGATNRRDTARRMREVMELFPMLGARRKQYAGTLSGGERQVVAMARALMLEPRLLLLDEPSAGLSPAMVHEVFEHITRVNDEQGIAILLVEQNVLKGMEVVNRGYLLETGEVRLKATAEELRASPDIERIYLGGARTVSTAGDAAEETGPEHEPGLPPVS